MSQTFKEFLAEARDPKRTYTEKSVKGVVERVTAQLKGSDSGNWTKLARRYARLEASLVALKEQRDRLNLTLKDQVADVFDPADVVLTRVVETAQFTITLNKQTKKPDTTETRIDFEKIAGALAELISDDLQPKVDEIVKQYTTVEVVPGKTNAASLKVSKEELNEAMSFGQVTAWVKRMVKSITDWASRYDRKLDGLRARAGK